VTALAIEHYGRVTDDALAELRAKIGQEMRISAPPYLTEANADAIRHWAEGIGDRNPLWTDPEYAAKTRWGMLLAPPTILYAFDRLAIGYRGGLPGIHSFFAGSNWDFRLPVRVGDKISVRVVFKDLVELKSRFAGRMFQQISEITFTNQRAEAVAVAESWGMRTERGTASDTGKYKALELASYSKHALAEIAETYQREEIRGPQPRYWEDVVEGDDLPTIIRGPYTVTTAIAFEQAWGGIFIQAHGRWFNYISRHPNAGIPSDEGVPEPPERVHWDSTLARKVGVPAAYDYGPERVAWLGSLVTNWMGDDALLRRLNVQVRRFNLIGDLTSCSGHVTDKEVVDGEHLVHVDIQATDQRGETTATGTASVVLPTRADGVTANGRG
jgi:acyl dehydratase